MNYWRSTGSKEAENWRLNVSMIYIDLQKHITEKLGYI